MTMQSQFQQESVVLIEVAFDQKDWATSSSFT
jgi:hypothetical protein